ALVLNYLKQMNFLLCFCVCACVQAKQFETPSANASTVGWSTTGGTCKDRRVDMHKKIQNTINADIMIGVS
ncbi:hypothetical protein PJP12_29735, partial [Mycobacterium kansasii]